MAAQIGGAGARVKAAALERSLLREGICDRTCDRVHDRAREPNSEERTGSQQCEEGNRMERDCGAEERKTESRREKAS